MRNPFVRGPWWGLVPLAVVALGCGDDASRPREDAGSALDGSSDALDAGGEGTVVSLEVTTSAGESDGTVRVDGTLDLVATATFSDGSSRDVTADADWTTSAAAVATVSREGRARGVAAGTAEIGAMFMGAEDETPFVLTVTAAVIESISITPALPDPLPRGRTQQLAATGNLSDGTTLDLTEDASLTWSSSKSDVASVSNAAGSKGIVTGLSPGMTQIGASFDGGGGEPVSATVSLTVSDAVPASVSITPAQQSVPAPFEVRFTATTTYSDGTTRDDTEAATWSSSDTSIATVSDASGTKGTAAGALPGVATVTATLGGVSGTATLTVTNAALQVIDVTPNPDVVTKGATRQYVATGHFSDGTTLDITGSVSWTVADEDPALTYASISNAAGSQGVLSALEYTDPQADGDADPECSGKRCDFVEVTATHGAIEGVARVRILTDVVTSVLVDVGGFASDDGLHPAVSYDSGGSSHAGQLLLGQTAQAWAECVFEDGRSELCNDRVTFMIAQATIASVSNDAATKGVVSGLSAGSATLTVTPITGASISPATLLVVDCPIQSLFVTVDRVGNTLLLPQGASEQAYALAVLGPENVAAGCDLIDGVPTYFDATRAATWASSNEPVATVSNAPADKGRVTANADPPLGPLTSNVTASFSGELGTLAVTVGDPCIESVALTPRDATVPFDAALAVGVRLQFRVTATMSDASTVDLTLVDGGAWLSDTPTVATVDPALGVVRTQGPGTTTIHYSTNKLGSCSGSAEIDETNVTVAAATLGGLSIQPATVAMGRGETRRNAAIGTFSDGSSHDVSISASWTTSNCNLVDFADSASLCTQGAGGVINGVVFATQEPAEQGTAVVVATVGTFSAATSVRVSGAVLRAIKLVVDDTVPFNDNACGLSQPDVAGGADAELSEGPFPVGQRVRVRAIGVFSDFTTDDVSQSVTWNSDDTAVATVMESGLDGGLVTFLAAGDAALSARLGPVTSDQDDTVPGDQPYALVAANATLLDIDTATADGTGEGWTMPIGTSVQFYANGLFDFTGLVIDPPDARCDVTTTATWDAAPSGRISVSSAGLASAPPTGTTGPATVTASIQLVSDPSAGSVVAKCVDHIEILESAVSTPIGLAVDVHARVVFSDGSSTISPVPSFYWYELPSTTSFSIQNESNGTATLSGDLTGSGTIRAELDTTFGGVPGCPGLPLGGLQGVSTDEALVTVTPATLSGIATDCTGYDAFAQQAFGGGTTGLSAPVGVHVACTATGFFSDGSIADVTRQAVWSTNLAGVAEVDASGLITTRGVGTASITATIGTVSDPSSVQVNNGTLRGAPAITVSNLVGDPDPLSRPPGFTIPYQAIGNYGVDGGNQFLYDITSLASWTTSAMVIANVNNTTQKGTVTTLMPSGMPVQVIASYQALQSFVNLTVNAGSLLAIDVLVDGDPIFLGLATPATALGTYSAGPSPLDITSLVTWSTSNGAVAMVSSSAPTRGFVTGLAQGTVDVIATRSGVTGTYVGLDVVDVCLVSISLTPTSPSIPLGAPLVLTVTGTLSNGDSIDVTGEDGIVLTSSDPGRLPHPNADCCDSVPNGLTAVPSVAAGGSPGTVVVTADASSLVGVCPGASSLFDTSTVTVVDAVLEAVTVEPNSSSLGVGSAMTLRALGHFSDGGSYDLTQVADWAAESTAIATVGDDLIDEPSSDINGKGIASGVSAGTAIITATVGSLSGSAVLIVTD